MDPNYNVGDNLNEGLLLGFEKNSFDWIGYSLDGQNNLTIIGNTTISMPADGFHTIQIFGNVSSGVMYQSDMRYFSVDTKAPISYITFIPHSGFNIVNKTTIFTLNADDGLGSGVSVIRYRINNSDWIDYTNKFNLSSYVYGDYLISYQAIDLVDNIENENTLIVRLVEITSKPSRPAVPGYNILLFIGIISLISIFLIKKQKKPINNF